jgi:hypothetical protein
MSLRHTLLVLGAVVLTAGPAAAQATGTASFNAPYRAFDRYEFGGTLSFNEGDVIGVEGQLRFGYRMFDIGLRGGMLLVDVGDDAVVLGAEGRGRVLTHTEQFPLDGAIVAGLGLAFDGGTLGNIPVGLSLGRRVDIENSDVSIVPYVQPTGNLVFGDTGDGAELGFSVGFGLDARLSRFFDARVSAGLGTDWGIEGFAVSAVWIR